MCNREGPIVKFLDPYSQNKVVDGERIFKNFIVNNKEWVHPNVQVMTFEGDKKAMRMMATQVHYKSLRGLKDEEYMDNLGAKSYAEVVVGKFGAGFR